MPLIQIDCAQATLTRALKLCDDLNLRSLNQLFDQMVEELEWSMYYSAPVKAALLASRVSNNAAVVPDDPEQIAHSTTSKEL